MRRFLSFASALLILCAPGAGRAATPERPPVAPVRDSVETLWGVPVHDPYRYMEDMADPVVQQWFRAQAEHTTTTLARIPGREALLARLRELDSGRPFRVTGIQRTPTGRTYYEKLAAGENISKLCVRASADAPEQVLVDPSAIVAPDGGHWALSFWEPSPDHRYVLYGLAASGSEQDILHVLDTTTGKDLPDVIDRMEAGYTEPQWLPDGTGFVYARRRLLAPGTHETEGYKRTAAFLHRLGTDPDKDARWFAKDLWPNVTMTAEDFPSIVLPRGSNWAIGKIKHGDSRPLTLYAAPLGDGSGITWKPGAPSPWTKICDVADSVTSFAVHGDEIWLVSAVDGPTFQVVRTPLAKPDFAHATVVLPADDVAVVDNVACAKDAAYVTRHRIAVSEVLRIGYGAGAAPVALPAPAGYPSARIVSAAPDVDGVVVTTAAWTRAGRTYAYDPATRGFADTHLSAIGRFDDLPGFESVEVEVPARDGVKVPLSIVYKAGLKHDGSNPTLITAYGSYGNSRNVTFTPTTLAWLERGGVYAVAHVRGGGEKGEAWHLAGQKRNKPNTWRDLIDCAEYLVKEGWTSPAKLAGQGGSAGGITIGRAVTERPDLFAAALFDVGTLNTLRAEFTMNGVPNIQEFGTVTDSLGFRALYEMDTYQHVKDGVKYPAILLSHGINDPRVNPWESGKAAARLQAATASGKPVLLRIDYHGGHGAIGSTRSQSLQATADKYAFLLWQMGLLKPVP